MEVGKQGNTTKINGHFYASGNVDYEVKKPKSLTNHKYSIANCHTPSKKRDLAPIHAEQILNSNNPNPNYMVGLGFNHGQFNTLEDTGNFRFEKGIFVP